MNMISVCQKRTSFLENFKIRAVIKKTIIELKKNIEIEIKSKTSLTEKVTKVAKLDK